MPSPKSGKQVNSVKPADPDDAMDADIPDPIKMAEVKSEQKKTEKGKYGSTKVKPHKEQEENEDEEDEKKSWIEIQLIDEQDKPVPGQAYKITLPDGSVDEGTLDGDGLARVDNIDPGTCKITFPDLDKDAWEKA